MKKILTLCAMMLVLLSCSDDDDNGRNALSGTWQMTHYLSYSDAPPPVLAPGDVTWHLNSKTLTVVNHSDDSRVYPRSGTYSIDVNARRLLVMQDEFDSYYRYDITGNDLTLAEGEEGLQDGTAIKFTKLLEE